jgi:hypothetical protein
MSCEAAREMVTKKGVALYLSIKLKQQLLKSAACSSAAIVVKRKSAAITSAHVDEAERASRLHLSCMVSTKHSCAAAGDVMVFLLTRSNQNTVLRHYLRCLRLVFSLLTVSHPSIALVALDSVLLELDEGFFAANAAALTASTRD